MSRYKIKAKDYFRNREYKKAFDNFSFALNISPNDLDLKIGILLSDLALENEDEANILYQMYENARSNQIESIGSIIEKLFYDSGVGFKLLNNEDVTRDRNIYELHDGIEYNDFKNFVDERESFKVALEDILFSTKIIIDKKDDFIEFLTLLLNNGYTSIALNYLESAISLYPHELFFQDILKQIEG